MCGSDLPSGHGPTILGVMDSGGSFTEGGLPDEENDGSDGLPSRGWLPPDDRLWLHPSEMAKCADADDLPPASPVPTPAPDLVESFDGLAALDDLPTFDKLSRASARGDRPQLVGAGRGTGAHPRTAGIVSVAAVVVAVAMVVLMTDRITAANRSTPALTAATTSLTTAVTPTSQLQATMSDVRASLVGLVVSRHGSQHLETGVAMAPGNLVVTADAAVAGATGIVAVTAQGRRMPAKLLGTDSTSGVSVVQVHGRVDPARFSTARPQTGELAITECLCQSASAEVTNAPLTPTVVFGRIEAVGVGDDDSGSSSRSTDRDTGAPAGARGLIDTVEADYAPVTADAWGDVLVNGNGQVAGILAGRTHHAGRRLDVFVPGWLAEKVAATLAVDHRIVHGWLGVTGSSEHGSCGAVVDSVIAGAPAQHALVPGDVVVGVDGRPVCNWSELQASLYVVPPDQTVDLSVDGRSGSRTVAVQLSPSPS